MPCKLVKSQLLGELKLSVSLVDRLYIVAPSGIEVNSALEVILQVVLKLLVEQLIVTGSILEFNILRWPMSPMAST